VHLKDGWDTNTCIRWRSPSRLSTIHYTPALIFLGVRHSRWNSTPVLWSTSRTRCKRAQVKRAPCCVDVRSLGSDAKLARAGAPEPSSCTISHHHQSLPPTSSPRIKALLAESSHSATNIAHCFPFRICCPDISYEELPSLKSSQRNHSLSQSVP